MESEPTRPRLPELTSLRFFAALAVVFYHLSSFRLISGFGWFQNLYRIGYVGVSFFFVLSGFILVYTYAGHEWKAAVFWRARFARIYPAYGFSLLAGAPIFYMGLKMHLSFYAWAAAHLKLDCLLVITLVQAWVPRAALTWNAVAWSLSVEAFFYVLFPVALLLLIRRSVKQLLWIVVACWLTSAAFSCAYVLLRPDGLTWATEADNTAYWLAVVKFNPVVRLPEFLAGMACGLVFLRTKSNKKRAGWLVGVSAGAIVLVTIFQDAIPYPVIHTSLLIPVFGAIIYGFALQPRWGAILQNPFLTLLGDASYSLYLLHVIILIFMFFASGPPHAPSLTGIAVYLAVTLLVSILVYKFLEEPARRRLNPRRREKTQVTKFARAAGQS